LLDGLRQQPYHRRNTVKTELQKPRTKFQILRHLEIGFWKLVLGKFGSWRDSWQFPSGGRRMPGKANVAAINI
jgi:hypothetical protein